MVAGKFRAYTAEHRVVFLAAGIDRAYARACPLLAVAFSFAAAATHAVGPLPATLATFAAGRDAAEINLLAH